MDVMANELYHYGVLGMKWGVRRYQNKDGTLTSEGVKRSQSFRNKQANKDLARERKGVLANGSARYNDQRTRPSAQPYNRSNNKPRKKA